MYLPETHKVPEAVGESVRISFLVLGNVINISVVTANNVRFKNKYKYVLVWKCFKLWFLSINLNIFIPRKALTFYFQNVVLPFGTHLFCFLSPSITIIRTNENHPRLLEFIVLCWLQLRSFLHFLEELFLTYFVLLSGYHTYHAFIF